MQNGQALGLPVVTLWSLHKFWVGDLSGLSSGDMAAQWCQWYWWPKVNSLGQVIRESVKSGF